MNLRPGGGGGAVSLFQNMASRLISAKNMATYFAAASRPPSLHTIFFSFHICDRAAEYKQVEKNRIKIRLCIPEILHVKVWGLPVITSKTGT